MAQEFMKRQIQHKEKYLEGSVANTPLKTLRKIYGDWNRSDTSFADKWIEERIGNLQQNDFAEDPVDPDVFYYRPFQRWSRSQR